MCLTCVIIVTSGFDFKSPPFLIVLFRVPPPEYMQCTIYGGGGWVGEGRGTVAPKKIARVMKGIK